jgi:hypothetical protein
MTASQRAVQGGDQPKGNRRTGGDQVTGARRTGGDQPPPKPSDMRLKTDIRQVGHTVHALPLYEFRYLNEDGVYEGVMAQDVLNVMPEAVITGEDGFYRVDYALLGTAMRRLQ